MDESKKNKEKMTSIKFDVILIMNLTPKRRSNFVNLKAHIKTYGSSDIKINMLSQHNNQGSNEQVQNYKKMNKVISDSINQNIYIRYFLWIKRHELINMISHKKHGGTSNLIYEPRFIFIQISSPKPLS